jgi:hypothetical protein
MKRYLVILATAAALCVPAAALADATPNASQLAVQSCKTQQAALGATFKATYGANAYGKCVSKAMATAKAAVQNAAQTCKAEQADANFAATHNGQTFDAVYGNGSSKGKGADANAYGKCVSTKAKATTQAQTQALVSAAKSCKADRAANKASFATTYGSKANAFGKCVALKAKS